MCRGEGCESFRSLTAPSSRVPYLMLAPPSTLRLELALIIFSFRNEDLASDTSLACSHVSERGVSLPSPLTRLITRSLTSHHPFKSSLLYDRTHAVISDFYLQGVVRRVETKTGRRMQDQKRELSPSTHKRSTP